MLAKPLDPEIHYKPFTSLTPHNQGYINTMRDMFAEYLVRDFTREEDSLRAFRGVFQHFLHEKIPIIDVCGLPIKASYLTQFRTVVESYECLSKLLNWTLRFAK